MKGNVIIKGNKNGIKLVLDDKISFDELKNLVAKKFKSSAGFFKDSSVALEFEGRQLSDDEQVELIDIISENSDLNIVCISEGGNEKEKEYKNLVNEGISNINSQMAQFYKGTVRSGQVLESPNSLVIIGDVNPGGKVVAGGSVVVIGTLKGIVFAGGKGNEKSFVIALDMQPIQIKICDIIARSPDYAFKGKQAIDVKIAFIEDDNIYIEPLNKDVLNDIEI
ncbi:MAG: septum site-determining protein MinC [Parasporobacterium sp.]|nr:septum site-determining protein MinC [Parasporobacterium sp.]